MEPMSAGFLLALQASGMITDWYGKKQQMAFNNQAEDLDQANINSNIASVNLAAQDQSLEAMKQLRSNLGTQAAMYAAKGVAGPAVALSANESVANFNADERMRKLNTMGSVNNLRGNQLISKLRQRSYNSSLGNQFLTSSFNNAPTSATAWKGLASVFNK